VLAQVAVSATAQAGQIAVVRLIRPAHRRSIWALLGLLAAVAMASVWALGTQVLRSPAGILAGLAEWSGVLRWSPMGALVAPLAALAGDDGAGAVMALAVLAGGVVLALGLAYFFARWASANGWEHAGAPWAEAGAATSHAAPLTPFAKEILLLVRDRSRLLAMAVAPAIFVGVQIFGSAGWDWVAANPRHAAMLSFSLAAYLATYGPLGHMNGERHAFWLLRVSPFPLGRLMAWKACFWALVVGSTAALAYTGVWLLAPLPTNAETLGLGLLTVMGATVVSVLAVAMGCSAADLSDPGRPAVGVGTVWLFMITAALFNAALLGDGQVRVRALLLFGLCVGLHWMTGMENLTWAYDPESRARKRVWPGDGAALAILYYLGHRVENLALHAPTEQQMGSALWSAVLLGTAGLALWRCPPVLPRRGWPLSLVVAGAAGAACASARGLRLPVGHADLFTLSLAVGPITEEVLWRGILQRSLAERWRSPAGQVATLLVSMAVAWLAGGGSLSPSSLLTAGAGAVVWAVTRRTGAAILARAVLEFLS
ncbi:MAG TPA: CPBP family glutamic-type intramembrane protease, partial [Polyangia bacterium]